MGVTASAVIVGIGELGAVFARGLLRIDHPVFPVTRTMRMRDVARDVKEPAIVLLATGETELPALLPDLPENWRSRVTLVQNELLPRVWEPFGLEPSVVVVWFEKKRGQDVKVVLPSLAFGPTAELTVRALTALTIPAQTLADSDSLLFELCAKNLYILTTNIAGLCTRGSVSELWTLHKDLALAVAFEVLELEQRLAGRNLPREPLIEKLEQAILADPEHACTGRSAPARLQRALAHAQSLGLKLPTLHDIAQRESIR
jgi:hypothetical protein